MMEEEVDEVVDVPSGRATSLDERMIRLGLMFGMYLTSMNVDRGQLAFVHWGMDADVVALRAMDSNTLLPLLDCQVDDQRDTPCMHIAGHEEEEDDDSDHDNDNLHVPW
jgi:hypothetical protein